MANRFLTKISVLKLEHGYEIAYVGFVELYENRLFMRQIRIHCYDNSAMQCFRYLDQSFEDAKNGKFDHLLFNPPSTYRESTLAIFLDGIENFEDLAARRKYYHSRFDPAKHD